MNKSFPIHKIHKKRGGRKRVVLTWELEVLSILRVKGGAKSYHPLKGGREKFHPVLRREGGGGGGKKFQTSNFPIL